MFLSDPSKYKRDDFIREIKTYEETIEKIKDDMPYEIRMNMILIDCVDLNKKLVSELEELIFIILSRASDFVFQESSAAITTSVKAINESFQAKADSSKKLVAMEKELDEIKLVKRQQLVNEYNELVEWLMLIYNHPTRFKVPEE